MGNLRIQRGRGYNPQQRNIEPQDTSANPIQTTAGVAELIAQIGSMNKDIQNQKILKTGVLEDADFTYSWTPEGGSQADTIHKNLFQWNPDSTTGPGWFKKARDLVEISPEALGKSVPEHVIGRYSNIFNTGDVWTKENAKQLLLSKNIDEKFASGITDIDMTQPPSIPASTGAQTNLSNTNITPSSGGFKVSPNLNPSTSYSQSISPYTGQPITTGQTRGLLVKGQPRTYYTPEGDLSHTITPKGYRNIPIPKDMKVNPSNLKFLEKNIDNPTIAYNPKWKTSLGRFFTKPTNVESAKVIAEGGKVGGPLSQTVKALGTLGKEGGGLKGLFGGGSQGLFAGMTPLGWTMMGLSLLGPKLFKKHTFMGKIFGGK
tara:strand:- start:1310 stop:2431 length:1122 start_codon:yes stop_codon:yes gene_type:complete